MKIRLHTASKVTGLFLLLWAIASCEKVKCEREEPVLLYDTLFVEQSIVDSLVYRTSFEDCQGDIGHIGKVDSTTPRSVRTYLYELIDGEWVRFVPPNPADTIAFFSIIPGSNKNREGWLLKGQLIQKFGLANLKQNSDTIRFETFIRDRADNRSNTVTSPTFVFPE